MIINLKLDFVVNNQFYKKEKYDMRFYVVKYLPYHFIKMLNEIH